MGYMYVKIYRHLLNKGYCNTNISALDVLQNFIQTKQIVSEVISKENIEYLNN